MLVIFPCMVNIFMSNDSILLEKLKLGFNYKSDAELAIFLGLSPSAVSQIRNGLISLSAIQRLKIIDRLVAIAIRDALVSMMPEHLGQKIMKLSLNVALRYVSNKKINQDLSEVSRQPILNEAAGITKIDVINEIDPINLENKMLQLDAFVQQTESEINKSALFNQESSDARLIDMFKNHFGFKTDTDLGDFLGLKKSAITGVRKGRSRLGEIARIRMLGKIDSNFDSIRCEESIKSNDLIESLIEYIVENKIDIK